MSSNLICFMKKKNEDRKLSYKTGKETARTRISCCPPSPLSPPARTHKRSRKNGFIFNTIQVQYLGNEEEGEILWTNENFQLNPNFLLPFSFLKKQNNSSFLNKFRSAVHPSNSIKLHYLFIKYAECPRDCCAGSEETKVKEIKFIEWNNVFFEEKKTRKCSG